MFDLSFVDPVVNFVDDLFLTNEEQQAIQVAQTNADAGYQNAEANTLLAQAQLTAAQDAATFSEDEQRQLLIIIVSIIIITFIIGLFIILRDT